MKSSGFWVVSISFLKNPFSFSINTALLRMLIKAIPPPHHRRIPQPAYQGMSSIIFTAFISENGILYVKGGIAASTLSVVIRNLMLKKLHVTRAEIYTTKSKANSACSGFLKMKYKKANENKPNAITSLIVLL